MNRLIARISVVAMFATGLLVALGSPATASIEIEDYVVLPQTGHGDVVRLPGTSVLAITGGDDDPVVMVDVVQRTVREVPGTEGVRTLDLDQDGSDLHGVNPTTAEVVEIDVSSGEVARWPVQADICQLNDVVMRGGALWVSDMCGFRRIWRLDPVTGDVSGTGATAESLVGAPNSPYFYAFLPGSSGVLKRLEATPGGPVERDQGYAGDISGSLRISDDGGTLFVRETWPFSAPESRIWDAADLSASESWPSHVTWSDGVHVGVGLPREGVAGLAIQADQSVVNTFLPAGDETNIGTNDVRLVDDTLAVTGRVAQQKRLYFVAAPLLREPEVTLDIPWGLTGIDTPTPVTGSFQRDGAPVAGQELQLVQLSPTRRDLGTVVTDAQGEWSTLWRPDEVGAATLEVRYDGERDSVAREWVPVWEDYYRLDSTGPKEVQGGDPIAVTFRATHNGQPMEGIELDLARHRLALNQWQLEEATTRVTDAAGEVTVGTTAGAADRYDFVATHTFPEGSGTWEVHHSLAVRRAATVVTADQPQDAVPGDPVHLSLTLTTSDGEPLVGQQVRFEVVRAFDFHTTWHTATTDDQGRATAIDHAEGEGLYNVRYRFDGTAELDDAQYRSGGFRRTRIPTAMTVTGSETGEVGQATALHGTLSPAEGPVEVRLTDVYTDTVTTTTTDESGNWSAEVTPTLPGPNRWTASFPGTVRLAPSQQTFEVMTPRAATSIEDLSITGATYGGEYTLTGTFTGRPGPARLRVSWDDEASRDVITAEDGTFVFRARTFFSAGPHVVKVVYDGDFRHAPTQREFPVDVAKGDQGLQLSGPAGVSANAAFRITGRLNFSSTRSTELTVTGPDGAVTQVPISMNDTTSFGLDVRAPDTPGQDAQWTVTIPGDANHEADTETFTTHVKEPHSVVFTKGEEPFSIGREASLLIQVPGTTSPRATIRVSDPQGNPVWSWTGIVPGEGLDYRSTLRTAQRVMVSVDGDAEHHFTNAGYTIRPQLSMSTKMSRPLSVAGRYSLYGIRQEPRVVTLAEPYPSYPSYVSHVFQKLTPRGWETLKIRRATADEPRWVSRVDWRREVGVRYRVSHLYKADEWYRRTEGEWHFFRFR
jgi:hypothetical protein